MRDRFLFAVIGSLALHAWVLVVAGGFPLAWRSRPPDTSKVARQALVIDVAPAAPERGFAKPMPGTQARETPAAAVMTGQTGAKKTPSPVPRHVLARQPAPPAPTAEEWSFASQYTLKNSKGYRYSWGKQVRSMMGTAVEGPDAGEVRFRVEIAPDGTLAKLETLWTTSRVAEQLARQAIEGMPALPPTPTGQPLVFERTISFTPFASDWPPIYDDDCLPDPPVFTNPFAWDGKAPLVARAEPKPVEKHDPRSFEECLKQLPQNSIEAEVAREQRLQNQWGADKLAQ